MATKRGEHRRLRRAHLHRGVHRALEKPRARDAHSPQRCWRAREASGRHAQTRRGHARPTRRPRRRHCAHSRAQRAHAQDPCASTPESPLLLPQGLIQRARRVRQSRRLSLQDELVYQAASAAVRSSSCQLLLACQIRHFEAQFQLSFQLYLINYIIYIYSSFFNNY